MALSCRSKKGIFDIFFKQLRKENFEDLEYKSNWKFQTSAISSPKMAALKVLCENTQKSPFNSQCS